MAVRSRVRQKLLRSLFLVGQAVVLIAMQTASGPAAAQATLVGDSQTSAPSPELLGIEIGTEATWAKRVLQRRGFVLRETQNGPSWHWQFGTRMGHIVHRKYRSSITAAVMAGPAGEQLELVFVQTRNGAAVSRISLLWPQSIAPTMLSDAFKRSYGISKGSINTTAIRVKGMDQAVQPLLRVDAEARSLVLDAQAELQLMEQESVERAVRDAKLAEVLGW